MVQIASKPFQGLKPRFIQSWPDQFGVQIASKPFQGLKPGAYKIGTMVLNGSNCLETLSGIETIFEEVESGGSSKRKFKLPRNPFRD
jgi:hypothetical protein